MFAPVWQTYRSHIVFAACGAVYFTASIVALIAADTWSGLLPVLLLGALPFFVASDLKPFWRIFLMLVGCALVLLTGAELLFRARYFGFDAIRAPTAYSPLPPTQIPGLISPEPDSEIGYVFMPGVRIRVNGDLWEINGDGFRDAPLKESGASQPFRIVVLGDSFTLGVGVAREERFSDRLETLLNGSGERRVEVYNLGLAGLDLGQLSRVMEIFGPRYRADLVVIGLRPSQLREHSKVARPVRRDDEVRRPASLDFSFLRRYSFVLNVQREAVDAGLSRLTSLLGNAAERRVEPASGGKETTAFEDFVESAARYRDVHGVPVAFAVLRKMEFDSDTGMRDSLADTALHGDASRRDEHLEIARLADRYRVPVIDTYDAFPPDSRRADYIIFPGDGHPNASGHERYARAIAAWLRGSGLLPDGRELRGERGSDATRPAHGAALR